MTRKAALLLLAIGLSLAAPAAARRPPLRLIGSPADLVLQSDGSRFAVYVPRPGVIRVEDGLDGSSYDVRTPDKCLLARVGGGQALLRCANSPGGATYSAGTPLLMDLATAR